MKTYGGGIYENDLAFSMDYHGVRYQVVSVNAPEPLEDACRNRQISLVLVGYSLTPSEKRRVVAEALNFCNCPILELWDREPPRIRVDLNIFDHYSLTPEDFLDKVNTILNPKEER